MLGGLVVNGNSTGRGVHMDDKKRDAAGSERDDLAEAKRIAARMLATPPEPRGKDSLTKRGVSKKGDDRIVPGRRPQTSKKATSSES